MDMVEEQTQPHIFAVGLRDFLPCFQVYSGFQWSGCLYFPLPLYITHAALLSSSGKNFLSTSELIRLPDDCTIGYIIECKVGGQLLPNRLFHSHLENLQLIPTSDLMQQVSNRNKTRYIF